jgi:hypothetical protein
MAEAGDIKVKVKLETESGEPFDVQRFRLDPGDIIVLKTRRSISLERLREIKDLAKGVFVGHEVLILNELDLAAIATPATTPEPRKGDVP